MNKLVFKRVFAKNFRSIDNMGLDIRLDDGNETLVVSKDNGNGKSTMLVWAIFYGLFDKAYGDGCKKTSLVNTRNNKDCMVEVEFDTKGSSWLVRRGMKPTTFDIYKDGERVEDEAALKDYQAYLVSVLGFSDTTFVNSIVLGKDKFVPFSSMSAPERRKYIEPFMNLAVFGVMQEDTKAEIKRLKFEISDLEHKESIAKLKINERLASGARMRGLIDSANSAMAENLQIARDGLQSAIDGIAVLDAFAPARIAAQEKYDTANRRYQDMQNKVNQTDAIIRQNLATIQRINNNTVCGHCNQPITEQHRQEQLGDVVAKTDALKLGIERVRPMVEEARLEASFNMGDLTEINAKLAGLPSLQNQRASFERQIRDTEQRMAVAASTNSADLDALLAETETLKLGCARITDRLDALHTALRVQLVSETLLKDDGIKAHVVKSYIPYLSERINSYLCGMGMFLCLELDEDFEFTMNTPDRKNQTLANLSSGQRCRVDLAIMLAWRDLARVRASVACNILVMDEVLESLSEQGISDFIDLWRASDEAKHTNLFVISQRRTEFEHLFEDTICFAMQDGFTVISE